MTTDKPKRAMTHNHWRYVLGLIVILLSFGAGAILMPKGNSVFKGSATPSRITTTTTEFLALTDTVTVTETSAEQNPAPAMNDEPAEQSPSPQGRTTFGDGIHRVGEDIQPGTYRLVNPGEFCSWERMSGFGGTPEEFIAGGVPSGDTVMITIDSTDAGFKSYECLSQWEKI